MTLRIATWNVNSLHVRAPLLAGFLERVGPDVLCLQETKVPAGPLQGAGHDVLRELGYEVAHLGGGAYNGVLLASRLGLDDVVGSGSFGVPELDREPRLVTGRVAGLVVASAYAPHGRQVGHWHYDYKLAWLRALGRLGATRARAGDEVVLAGDLNVAPTDGDLWNARDRRGEIHVSVPEREALASVIDEGFVDVDLALHAEPGRYTWWSHRHGAYPRDHGMRVDFVLATPATAARVTRCDVDRSEREGPRPSDHAALVVDLGRLTSAPARPGARAARPGARAARPSEQVFAPNA